MAEEIVVNIKTKGTKEAKGTAEELNKEFGLLDTGVGKTFKNVVSGVKSGVNAMKTLKGAIIATGIGALVVIVGSLVAWFTKTEKGAQALRKITAALGVVVGGLTDGIFSLFTKLKNLVQGFDSFGDAMKKLGKAIVDNLVNRVKSVVVLFQGVIKLFKGDFKGGIKSLTDGFVQAATGITNTTDRLKKMGQGMSDAAKKINELVKAQNLLSDRQNALNVLNRESLVTDIERRTEAFKQQEIAKDQTKTIEERITALNRQGEIEKGLLNTQISRAKEQYNIIKAQNALTTSSEEDLQKEAEALAAVKNLELQRQQQLVALTAERSGLIKSEQDKVKAAQDEQAEKDKETKEKLLENEKAYQSELDNLKKEGVNKQEDIKKKNFEKDLKERLKNGEITETQAELQRIEFEKEFQKAALERKKKEYEENLELELKEGKITLEQLNNLKKENETNINSELKEIDEEFGTANTDLQNKNAEEVANIWKKKVEGVAEKTQEIVDVMNTAVDLVTENNKINLENQISDLEEGFDKSSNYIEKSNDNRLKSAEALRDKLLKGVQKGSEEEKKILEDFAKTELQINTDKDRQLTSSKENFEKNKAKIEKDGAKKQQKIDIAMAIVNAAQAILKSLTLPFPANLIAAAITGASTAIQVKEIKSQKFQRGGDVIGNSHLGGGVNVNLEGDEFINSKKTMAQPNLAKIVRAANDAGERGQSNLNIGLREEDIVKIAATVVKSIPVYITESAITEKQREVVLRNSKFSK